MKQTRSQLVMIILLLFSLLTLTSDSSALTSSENEKDIQIAFHIMLNIKDKLPLCSNS